MFWDKKIETLKTDDLQALQLKRLKKTISQAQKVGFFKKRLSDAGITASSIKTLDDIHKIPFTKKQDLREGYPFGFFAVPLKEIVRIHTTSGTTGKPTVVGYTKKDLDVWADLIARNDNGRYWKGRYLPEHGQLRHVHRGAWFSLRCRKNRDDCYSQRNW
jgi:phenylacetate-CoA ligase